MGGFDMHTMNLNAELFRELSYIADDERCLREVLAYVKQVVASRERRRQEGSAVAEEGEAYRPLTKAEVLEDIGQAFREAKLYREGKLDLKTWEEVRDEL